MALGALVIPTAAFAAHGGNNRDCPPPEGDPGKSSTTVSDSGRTVTVYRAVNSPPYLVKVGVCVDLNNNKAVGPVRFDGGTAEKVVGEDPGNNSGDPGGTQPDGYLVVDGDDDNTDPQGQSDGYVGLSNWETSDDRTQSGECQATGPDNGTGGSSNSGGCVGVDNGPWVYAPGDVPTPICGNSSGNAWDGSGSQGAHNRDGCQIP